MEQRTETGQQAANLTRRQVNFLVWFILTLPWGKIILMWILVETSASDVGTMFNPSPARYALASVTGRAERKGAA